MTQVSRTPNVVTLRELVEEQQTAVRRPGMVRGEACDWPIPAGGHLRVPACRYVWTCNG